MKKILLMLLLSSHILYAMTFILGTTIYVAPKYNGVVITGLQSGSTTAIAIHNSTVLNNALSPNGVKHMIIPDGLWYTRNTVLVGADTTVTFIGKIQQLPSAFVGASAIPEQYSVMRVEGSRVTLNNPRISQKGRIMNPEKTGTHCSLAIYGSRNVGPTIINGGVLEWGAHNSFQGGKNNTTFNGTIFRDSGEHLVYAHGGRRVNPSDPDTRPSGLTFNNCIMERPGNGEQDTNVEANHIQIRSFKNVTFNKCIVRGRKSSKISNGQWGLLATGIDGLKVIDSTFEDYSSGILWIGDGYNYTSDNVVFTNVNAKPDYSVKHIVKAYPNVNIEFNNLDVTGPYGVQGGIVTFNDSRFRLGYYYMKLYSNTDVTFNKCIWDASNSTYSNFLNIEAGAKVSFNGTQTKISPTDGHSFSWNSIP